VETASKSIRQIYALAKDDEKVRRLEVEILIKDFKATVKNFYLIQKKFLFQVKKNPLTNEPNYEAVLPRKSNLLSRRSVDLLEEEEAGPSGQQQVQEEFKVVPQDLEELEKRQKAFEQIESDIRDVNEMMKEMGQMVADQGASIQEIEEIVEEVAVTVEEAGEHIRQAAESANKRRKFYIIGTIVLILLIILIILPIKLL
jgi:hypothetical protein